MMYMPSMPDGYYPTNVIRWTRDLRRKAGKEKTKKLELKQYGAEGMEQRRNDATMAREVIAIADVVGATYRPRQVSAV